MTVVLPCRRNNMNSQISCVAKSPNLVRVMAAYRAHDHLVAQRLFLLNRLDEGLYETYLRRDETRDGRCGEGGEANEK